MTKLPNFVVAGAAKSGSTSLYEYCKLHPQIYVPEIKESRFFAAEHLKGTLGYNRTGIFDIDSFNNLYKGVTSDHKAIGDFGNVYMTYAEHSAKEIKKHLGPETKIVFILRNPVGRAFSAYKMALRNHYEDQSFERGLELEKQRLREVLCPPDIIAYRGGGLSYEPIVHYKKFFDVKVVILEELSANPNAELGDFFSFLGVDRIDIAAEEHNVAGTSSLGGPSVLKFQKAIKTLGKYAGFIPGSRAAGKLAVNTLLKFKKGVSKPTEVVFDERIKEELRLYYQPEIQRLSKLLDKDLASLWS